MRTRSACINIFLALSFSAVALTACSGDPTASVVEPERVALDRKVQELKDRYGWMGTYHTDGLEYVYADLSSTRGKRTRAEFCRVAARAVKEFHRQAGKGEIPFEMVDPAIADETCGREMGGGRVGKTVLVGNPRLAMDELAPLTISYVDQIEQAINSAISRAGLLSSLLDIQYAAVANLPEDQAGVVVAVVSIAISSMDYWEVNLDKWIDLNTIATPYARDAGMTPVAIAPAAYTPPKWWSNPFVQGFRKVLAADALGGARVLYTTWRLGPIGWDAAAAAAVFSSVTMTGSLLF
jgi:hypothetical protein